MVPSQYSVSHKIKSALDRRAIHTGFWRTKESIHQNFLYFHELLIEVEFLFWDACNRLIRVPVTMNVFKNQSQIRNVCVRQNVELIPPRCIHFCGKHSLSSFRQNGVLVSHKLLKSWLLICIKEAFVNNQVSLSFQTRWTYNNIISLFFVFSLPQVPKLEEQTYISKTLWQE